MRYKIIANPVAGHGNGLQAIPKIERALTKHGLAYDLVRTERPWHAAEITRQSVAEGYDVIVAAGGDGTVNEVINGLMLSRQAQGHAPALGVLCTGRGNDFASSLGIPEDLEQACQVLAAGRRRPIDIGRVSGGNYPQGRFFGNCVGVGFDAIATIEVARMPRWGGFFSFLAAVLKTAFIYNKAPLATIEYGQDTLTQRSLMISMMNGRQLGDGFIMAPDSKPDDGLLDLCIAEQVKPLRIFEMVPHFMRGDQATQPEIKTGRAAHIRITSQDGPLPAQTDGEIICTEGSCLEIELLPLQLEIICQASPGG
jgi:YegS/Rv2252/BmrU family lipid kinase